MTPALYIKPDGKVYLIIDCPKQPGYSAMQRLIHETNRITGTIIRYSDHLKKSTNNDSSLFVINEYAKSIRAEIDKYYTFQKENNESIRSELTKLREKNDRLRNCLDSEVKAKQIFMNENANLTSQLSKAKELLKECARYTHFASLRTDIEDLIKEIDNS